MSKNSDNTLMIKFKTTDAVSISIDIMGKIIYNLLKGEGISPLCGAYFNVSNSLLINPISAIIKLIIAVISIILSSFSLPFFLPNFSPPYVYIILYRNGNVNTFLCNFSKK